MTSIKKIQLFCFFLVSFFTAGVGADTLPMKLYALVKFGMNPQTYALSSIVLAVTGTFLLLSLWLEGRGSASTSASRKSVTRKPDIVLSR